MFNFAGRMGYGLYPHMNYWGGGYIMMILGVVLVGVLIYLAVRRSRNGNDAVESPSDLLKKRYVNGEISREQYLEMKKTLKK